MSLDLDRLMQLWDTPPEGDGGFRALYTDPAVLNGRSTSIAGLVAIAQALHVAVAGQSREILDVIDQGDGRLAVAFVVRGRHVGLLPTRLGPVPPTGRAIEMTVVDLFTVVDSKITEVRAVSDELGMLAGLDAISLR